MDIGLGLSLGGRGRGGTGGPAPLAPLSGVLDAANVVILGASISEEGFEDLNGVRPGIARLFADLGFTGTLHSYANGGDRVNDAIFQHAAARADLAADEGDNLYVVHIGGNNVTANRPYPGGAETFSADYATLMANVVATDRVLPLPLTKRLYSTPPEVFQGDEVSEANGSKPYNEAIIYPQIAANAPDWIEAGLAHVDPYAFVNRQTEMLDVDGVHGLHHAFARYVLSSMAGRALGQRPTDSRAGRALVFRLTKAAPENAYIGPINSLAGVAAGQPHAFLAGARFHDGTLDPFVEVGMSSYTGDGAGPGTEGYARLADTRLHEPTMVSNTLYVGGTDVLTLRFRRLVPGDRVTVTAAGSRAATGTNRRGLVTLAGGEALVLDGASNAVSNQVVFAPVTVPASGEIVLTLEVAAGSTYGYLRGVILDFD